MTGNTTGAERPQLLVFAGPNGSGKSTINQAVRQHFNGEYVNADDIARTLPIPDERDRNLQAADIARQRREAALQTGRDLAYETVMSTEEKVADLIAARRADYLVSLYFIITNDASLNVQRVINRVALGGHDVLESQIRTRYTRSLNLLACAVEKAQNAVVIDNSQAQPRIVMTKRYGQQTFQALSAQQPYAEFCVQHLQEREQSLAQLTQGQAWTFADASHGRTYAGVGEITAWHIALQTPGGLEVHDRQLVSEFSRSGDQYTVSYRYQHGKRVE